MRSKPKWLKRLVVVVVVVLVLFLVAGAVVLIFGPGWMRKTVEGEGFRAMLSREVSKSMKVDGEFAPLKLEGWTAVTDSYTSTGWPGEAIGALDAHGIRGTFNPAGVLKSQWLLSLIMVEEGRFVLRNPDDALKRHPVPGKKPWYAALMPRFFHINWIECAKADVEFPLGSITGGLRSVHLGATMIAQDFVYYVKDGNLEFPGFPRFAVDALKIYVTRSMVQVDYGYLRATDGETGLLQLSGRMGQREDKSIQVKLEADGLGIGAFLPEEVRPLLSGRVTGGIDYKTDEHGENAAGSGALTWTGAGLGNWGPLTDAARVPGRPDLSSINAETVKLVYTVKGGVFSVNDLDFLAAGKVRMKGAVSYDLKNKSGKLDVVLKEMPISVWLPAELKTLTDAMIEGNVQWQGSVKEWQQSSASGQLDFGGASVENPVRSIASMGTHSPRFPTAVTLEKASLGFKYIDRVLHAERLVLDAPGFFRVNGSGSWGLDDRLAVDIQFAFPALESWLPASLTKKLQGNLSGHVRWASPRLRLGDGSGEGSLSLEKTVLRDFKFQEFIARFLKDDAWLALDFSQVKLDWRRVSGGIEAQNIDFFAPDHVGLTGSLRIGEGSELSGKLQVGLAAKALTWLPGATETIFTRSAHGLHWAEVELSGTMQEPKQDLVPRMVKEITRHPLALAELAVRGVSWWLGDELGTAPGSKKKVDPPAKPKRFTPRMRD